MRVMFNTRPTHDFVRKQWDDEHDSRCSCGGRESLEHVCGDGVTLPGLKTHTAKGVQGAVRRGI
jgi:hypothetical protein